MVDIDINQFSLLKKTSSRSFHNQKSVIKKVLAGQKVCCELCKQPLSFSLASESLTSESSASKISCPKGCTDIELSIDQ